MKTPVQNRPVPAAVDGRRWTVSESPNGGGATDTKKADMFAPLQDGPTARMIRNHELIHARITPRIDAAGAAAKHGVTASALQWAEDHRVGLLQRRLGLVDVDALSAEEAAAHAKMFAHSHRMVAGALLATLPLPDQFRRLYDAFIGAGVDPDDLAAVANKLRSMIAVSYPSARRRGRRPAASSKFKPTGFAKYTVPLAAAFDAVFPESGPSSDGELEEARRNNRRVERVKSLGRWGVLSRVCKAPFSRAIRPRRPIGRRFSDAGVIPSAVHRLPVDGSIFATRRRARGGTILCDASGSMNYSDEDIERIISMAPAATIAFYSGTKNGGVCSGSIVIAAQSGRAASVDDVRKVLRGGHNLIDGPALRWLAGQPGPRFWVSDEEVGGVSDFGRGGPCWQECRQICTAASVTIVPDIDKIR